MRQHRRVVGKVAVLALAVALCVAGCAQSPSQWAGPPHPTSAASGPSRFPSSRYPISTTPPAVTTGHTTIVLGPEFGQETLTQEQLDSSADVLVKRFVAAGFPAPTVTYSPAYHGLNLDLDIAAPMTNAQATTLIAQGVVTFRAVLGTTVALPGSDHGTHQTGMPQDDAYTLAHVKSGLDDAYTLAEELTEPPSDRKTIDQLAKFSDLLGSDVAVLPAQMQFNVPTVSCAQLDTRSPLYVAAPRYRTQRVTACDPTQPDVKYLLDVAALGNADIAGAEAKYDATTYGATGGWYVEIDFTPAGQRKWASLTASDVDMQLAVVLDGSVLSAPYIQGKITGPAVISGAGIDKAAAHRMAALIGAGSLAVEFGMSIFASAWPPGMTP